MSKNIRTLYLYIVSLVTLGMIVGGTVGVVQNLTTYILPTTGYYSRYYDDKIYSEQEQTKQISDYQSWIETEKENVQRRALKDLFTCIALLVVAAPLYIYHFKLAKNIDLTEEK